MTDTANENKPQHFIIPRYHLLYPVSHMQNTCMPLYPFVIGQYTSAFRASFPSVLVTRLAQLHPIRDKAQPQPRS